MKLLLPTSTAGSLPKPSWLAEPEKIWSPWALEGEQLLEAKQDQNHFLDFYIFIVKCYLHDVTQMVYIVRLLGQGLSYCYTTANE